jgi:hypothetical protein
LRESPCVVGEPMGASTSILAMAGTVLAELAQVAS